LTCHSLSQFIGNGVQITNSSDILTGAGGALFVTNPGEDRNMTGGYFKGNYAVRGGALFIGKDYQTISAVTNARFEENYASIAGGAIFVVEAQPIYLRSGNEIVGTYTVIANDLISVTPNLVQNNINGTKYTMKIYTHTNPEVSFEAQFQFTINPCPKGKTLEPRYSTMQIYQCVDELQLDLILGLVIPLGILLFFVGVLLGILIIYGIMFVFKSLRQLKQKERAEQDIEQKIMDKRMIFDMELDESATTLTSPLLSSATDNSSASYRKKELPSFIIPIESIDIVKKVASGANGIVYLGKLWKTLDVAIKSLKSTEDDGEFEKEVSLLSSLRHESIVTFYGVCVSDTNKYMVTEYLSKGSLDSAIARSRTGAEVLSFTQKLSILIGVANGINYLHNLNPAVIHRDLKPGNILLDDKMQSRVCDFGISRVVAGTTTQSAITTNVGTLFYMAPESLDETCFTLPVSESKTSRLLLATKLDVYSFAIIMWEIFFEVSPYVSETSKLTPLYQIAEENNQSTFANAFNVPSQVIKGRRPIVPFKTSEQIEEWISQFVMPSERNSLTHFPQAVERYFNVLVRSWAQNPLDRPTFTEIKSDLESIQQLVTQRL